MSPPGPPDRWLNYKPTGEQIKDTPFVALKVPLSEDFQKKLPPECRFGVKELHQLLPRVSLIIDLTNTDKYYNPKTFSNIGVRHEKIRVPGRDIPKQNLLQRFFHIVDDFITENEASGKNDLIGVHCTHGVNRTGFFICCYMISKLGFNFENASFEFDLARGHKMERENYKMRLKMFEMNPLKFVPSPGSLVSQSRVTNRKRSRQEHSRANHMLDNAPTPGESNSRQSWRTRESERPTAGPGSWRNAKNQYSDLSAGPRSWRNANNQYSDPRSGNYPFTSSYMPPPLVSMLPHVQPKISNAATLWGYGGSQSSRTGVTSVGYGSRQSAQYNNQYYDPRYAY